MLQVYYRVVPYELVVRVVVVDTVSDREVTGAQTHTHTHTHITNRISTHTGVATPRHAYVPGPGSMLLSPPRL